MIEDHGWDVNASLMIVQATEHAKTFTLVEGYHRYYALQKVYLKRNNTAPTDFKVEVFKKDACPNAVQDLLLCMLFITLNYCFLLFFSFK